MIRALLVLCLIVATSYGAEVPTYLVIGQSNVGTPATNTMVYNRGSFPDSRVTLWSGIVGSLNLVSNQTLRAPATKHWGIEMLAGQVLADWHNGENIAIVKVYRGGTNLHTDWYKGNTNGWECYASLSNWFASATADMAASGNTPDVRGVMWMQGEDDANDGNHAAYYANLTNFIADIRSDYGANIRFGIGRLSRFAAWRAGLDTVRAAQEQAATDIANVYLVDTDPCEIPWDTALGRHDSHYSQQGLWDLGLRFGHGMTQEKRGTLGASIWVRNDGWSE